MKINNQEVSDDEVVKKAISAFVEEKGVPENERAEEEKKIEKLIDDRMTDEVLSALPIESLEKIQALLEKDDFSEEEFMKVIDESGVKMESVATKVLREFREEYIGPVDDNLEEEE